MVLRIRYIPLLNLSTSYYFYLAPLASKTHMGGYRSAIVHLYRVNELKMSSYLENMLADHMSGYTKVLSSARLAGQLPPVEGRDALTFAAYETLCWTAIKGPRDDVVYWAFQTLSWNLAQRSQTIGDLLLEHISWKDDCLSVVIPKHKGTDEC